MCIWLCPAVWLEHSWSTPSFQSFSTHRTLHSRLRRYSGYFQRPRERFPGSPQRPEDLSLSLFALKTLVILLFVVTLLPLLLTLSIHALRYPRVPNTPTAHYSRYSLSWIYRISTASSKILGIQLGSRLITSTVPCTADTGSGAPSCAQTTPQERG